MEIVFEGQGFFAMAKPSGCAVHTGPGVDGETVVAWCRKVGMGAVFTVHRLDRGTSGVLLVARSSETAHILSDAFAEGRVDKTYLALVRGELPDGEIVVDSPVPRDEGKPRVDATTRVRSLSMARVDDSPLREKRYAWVEARPETGRFHQVRRHLKHLGHPIIGDANYGKSEHNRFLARRLGLERLALHASRLELESPTEPGRRLIIEAPVPDDLAGPLALLGIVLS